MTNDDTGTIRGQYLRPWALTDNFLRIPLVVLQDAALGLTDKVVWAVMAKFSRDKTYCEAPIEKIAEYVGIGRSATIEAIGTLREAGYLTSERRGLGLPNVYHFLSVKFQPGLMVNTPDEVVDTSRSPEGELPEVREPDFRKYEEQTSPNVLGVETLKIDSYNLDNTGLNTHSELQKPTTPITDQTGKCLRRLERDRHFGKLRADQRRQLLETIQTLPYSEEDVLSAMDQYLVLDYWHEHQHKVGSFLNFLKGEQWRPAEATSWPPNPGFPAVAEAQEVPNHPPHTNGSVLAPPITKSYKCRWNEVFPDRPAGPMRAAVEAAAQSQVLYVENFDKILSKARAIVDRAPGENLWLQYTWLHQSHKETGEPNWHRLLSGVMDGLGKSDIRPERDTTATVGRRLLDRMRKEREDAEQKQSAGV